MENKLISTLEYPISAFAGVVAQVVVEPGRDIESLPLASLGDYVRGLISAFEPCESTLQVEGCLRVC